MPDNLFAAQCILYTVENILYFHVATQPEQILFSPWGGSNANFIMAHGPELGGDAWSREKELEGKATILSEREKGRFIGMIENPKDLRILDSN